MYSHMTVGTSDIEKSIVFYDAALAPLGIPRYFRDEEAAGYSAAADRAPSFWVVPPFDGKPMTTGNGVHVAFEAETRAAVDAFYEAAMANGGTDEGTPGLRPQYHADYYGAYVRDPDGNKLQAVCHQAE